MGLKFSNFARAKLATPPSGTGGLSFTVESGKGALFPTLAAGDYTYVVLKNSTKTNNEVVKVEARSGDSFTIAAAGRGLDGTTAQTWTVNDYVECCLTQIALAEVFNAACASIGALTPAANKLPYFTSATAAALTDFSSFVRGSAILGAADAPAARAALTTLLTSEMTLESSDAGSAIGPDLLLDRNSASPAANDQIGNIQFLGRNTAGTPRIGYARIQGEIVVATAGSETGAFVARVFNAGTQITAMTVTGSGGGRIDCGAPAGAVIGSERLRAGNGIVVSAEGGSVVGRIGDFGGSTVILGAYSNHEIELHTNNSARFKIGTSGGLYGQGVSGGDQGAGTANLSALYIAGTQAPAVAASQAQMEAASSNLVAVTPGRQHYHPTAAKAWCEFNASGSIVASYFVASVTDHGTGRWTVNFTSAFSSANYVPLGSCRGYSGGVDDDSRQLTVNPGPKTSSGFELFVQGGTSDSNYIYALAFGDL